MNAEPPFTVLGIDPDADEKAIKRAYVALVRQHRPDKDPAGFARIHAAYEAALNMHEQRGPRPSAPTSPADLPALYEHRRVTSPPHTEARLPSGDEERSRHDQTKPPSGDGSPSLAGEKSEPPRFATARVQDAIAFAPPVTLDELIALVGEDRAARLVNEATDSLLLEGHGDYLWRELTSPAGDRLLLATRTVESALLKTSAYLSYVSSRKAKALLGRIELDRTQYPRLEVQVFVALRFAKGFRAAGGLSAPKELRRLIRLLPIVRQGQAQALVDEAIDLGWSRPADFLEATSALDWRLLDSIGREAFRILDVDPSSLSEREPAHALREPLAVLATSVERFERKHDFRAWRFVAAMVGGGALLLSVLPWLAVVLLGGGFAGLAIRLIARSFSRHEELTTAAGYRAQVREALLRLTLETGVSPSTLVGFIARTPSASELRPYSQRILGDTSLQFAHRLALCASPNSERRSNGPLGSVV